VLRALGAPVEEPGDAPGALRARLRERWQQLTEPVVVAAAGRGTVDLRLPAKTSDSLSCHLQLEDGSEHRWTSRLARLRTLRAARVEGQRYRVKQLALPLRLPLGYHRLRLELGKHSAEPLIISPPAGAYIPEEGPASHTWGVFLPLHAFHSRQSWGSGTFADLEIMMEWVGGLGGGVVATLPFLAAFLDEPCEPSPYSPVSRLFWNEFFLDISGVPELAASPSAQGLLASPAFRQEADSLRAASLVDYRRGMALKRKVLEELARALWVGGSERRAAFENFVATHPILQDYARFRAVGERRRAPWPAWPLPLRDGTVRDGDYDDESWRYHLYVQWLAHQQLHDFAQKARQAGPGLYLDLPLGVHPDGYDVWRNRDIFASGVSGGAPPDSFFTKGQDWGFPPLHPERVRQQGHRYFIACLRHHLRYAGILRIDHVMGLHRLFWVPQGMKAIEGVYVRYPARELYAILALESQRHQALIVGEDLGTVPAYVRPAMARHNAHRSYVVQYELTPDPRRALRPVSRDSLASLNTHDMPTFAGFWKGLDIENRVEMGLLETAAAPGEQSQRKRLKKSLIAFLQRQGWLAGRASKPLKVLHACLGYLGASRSRVVTVNLEDLWGETHPQNVPGTTQERPNWRRKARYGFERFSHDPAVLKPLQRLSTPRQRRTTRR
jgi:4-alpha-glucanotransferase